MAVICQRNNRCRYCGSRTGCPCCTSRGPVPSPSPSNAPIGAVMVWSKGAERAYPMALPSSWCTWHPPRSPSPRRPRRPSPTSRRSRRRSTWPLKICGRSLKTHLNKKDTKVKTKAKFDIVQIILPLIAEKSAKIVGKPIPSLSGTITKIMNVVWIDDAVTYEKKTHKVRVTIYNYTPKGQKMNLHMVLPQDKLDYTGLQMFPAEVKDDGKVTWELRTIPSTHRVDIQFQLKGLDQEAYDENEVYVSGINPILVIGAEPLPGDWDVKALQISGDFVHRSGR